MTNTPPVSVIMPVYNAEKYVAQAVESILNQTFTDFEFLIVDDGSTDASLAILQKYAAQDPRIKLRSRPNTGYVVALNEMLAEAQGEFIARMDADDISMPERFEMQFEYLNRNSKVLAVGTAQQWIDPVGLPLRKHFPPMWSNEIDQFHLERFEGCLCHPSVMMRSEALKLVKGYDESLFGAEDLDVWLRLAEIGQIMNLREVLIQYRFHPSKVGWKHKRRQVEAGVRAVEAAAVRRGLAIDIPSSIANFAEPTCKSQFRTWGWWALGDGNRYTARKYGLRSVVSGPLEFGAWRLLYCALRGR